MKDNSLIQKIIDSQEIKTVQFNLENFTINPLAINLFDSSAITNQNVSTSSIVAGTIDTSFVYGTGFNNVVFSIAIQSDNKILVGGGFTDYNGTPANRIIRLNSNGSIDTSFVYGTGFNNTPQSIAIQSDGKILVGGNFTSYNGTSANHIIRLNSDGSVDTSFVYGTGFNGDVYSIAIQSDSKILVGGFFTTYDGTGANNIIRLNTDGTIDTSFVYGTGYDSPVASISIQSDGKIVVGGYFTNYNGTSANYIIRLNTDGSIDTSFVYGTGFNNTVFEIAIQSDGKLVVGGGFITYNGTGAKRIIRLNSNGSIDTSFVYGTGFNTSVASIVIQSDGKILLGGSFITYNGTGANRIIRLNSDGSVDTSFVYGTGFNNPVASISIQSNGAILVGGGFITYNGTSANRIVSLTNNTTSYTISGGSVDYNFFVQTLNNDPKIFCDILIKMPQIYLANNVNVIYTDANGQSTTTSYLPNIEIDAFQKSPNRGIVKFENGLVININTQIQIILPPLTTVILLIDYKEFLKSDMLDLVIYDDNGKAKYFINETLENGEITANKYWGSKSMPKKMVLDKEWLSDMRNRFSKVEVLEYDTPKLAGGTSEMRSVYQDLFGFKKEVKASGISITEKPKLKKDVEFNLSTMKQLIGKT